MRDENAPVRRKRRLDGRSVPAGSPTPSSPRGIFREGVLIAWRATFLAKLPDPSRDNDTCNQPRADSH